MNDEFELLDEPPNWTEEILDLHRQKSKYEVALQKIATGATVIAAPEIAKEALRK